MSEPRKYLLKKGEKISNWEKCICGNLSEMNCICEGNYDTRDHDSEANDWIISNFKVLRCPSCGEVTILKYITSGNDFEELNHPPEYGSDYIEYEREILFSPAKPRHFSIPTPIKDVINQAEKILPVSPRAAFILCRVVLEEICRDRGISNKKTAVGGKTFFVCLRDQLKLLFERENISNDIQKIMDGIKDLGNEGAHGSQTNFTSAISIDEAENLLELTDYVIEYLYINKARAQDAINKIAILDKKVHGLKDKNDNDNDMVF